ncbi:M24 family metallopeptidase [Floricoccus penangensis]|uniref:M24 family metallopeptidase n=1 Tax=Floricoccus penangensis TaxID=1859475 RepID=UPI00203EE2B2|nr:aminopeptidase P family protein [Floricoccus penangensis]URZ86951.1 aminopeptidase P family protein [Floricoccus penangensis]
MERIEKLRNLMKEDSVESLLITNLNNIFYLTGFWGTSATVLVTENDQYFITDARYTLIANETVENFKIIESRQPLVKVDSILKSENISYLQFEGEVSFAFYQNLKNTLSVDLKASSNLVEKLRIIKDNSEIKLIEKACSISDQAFIDVLDFIKVGISELDVANFLDFRMRELGASGISFETIVASGNRSSMPHGVASDKLLELGDTITLDFGCYYNHYVSDMTRTVFLGQPEDKMVEIYNTVLESNNTLINQTKAGLLYKDYDGIARDVIEQAGYGNYFTHGIGHGIGIDIHEDPFFGKTSEEKLQVGMVITDEPGIYVDDLGGVRIEDDLVVLDNGCKIITKAPKELIII